LIVLQAWKPFPASYGYAVKQLGLPDDKVLMVASHPWDIAGAMQVGGFICHIHSCCTCSRSSSEQRHPIPYTADHTKVEGQT
jgi:FMN phosphatase YigB (HAD superfamily)